METPTPTLRLTLGAAEAAKAVGISRAQFYGEVARGKIPQPIKIGRRSVWPVDDVRAFIERKTAERDAITGAGSATSSQRKKQQNAKA